MPGSLAVLDWVFVAALLASMLLGVWRGLVYELLSLVSWVIAFVLAQWFAPPVAQWLPLGSTGEALRYAAGFALVFVLSLFACGILTFVISKLVAVVGLRPMDRVLGAVFGLLRGMVLLLAATVVMGLTPVKDSMLWQSSQGVRLAQTVLGVLKPVLPAQYGKYLT